MRKIFQLFVVATLGLVAACGQEPDADMVLLDGNIYTVDGDLGTVQALAISDGIIVAAGATKDIRKRVGADTHVIDLEGSFAMPGFNDAHAHLGNGGQAVLSVNLQGSASLREFQDRIRARLGDFEPGQWVVGRGWDHSLWPENRIPTLEELDAISAEQPFIMTRVDGHSAVVNSAGLALAGITGETPAPEGGAIILDEAGAPTGWLIDRAMGLVTALVPPPTFEQHKHGLELAIANIVQYGVTSVQDDSVRGSGWVVYEAFNTLKAEGNLSVRITEWLPFDSPVGELTAMREAGGTSDPWLKTGALKINIDGSGGSLSAAMLEPYATAPDNRGLLIMTPEKLSALAVERDAAGFQIAIHAIGDRANRVVLDAFEAAQKANGRDGARHRIEHSQFVHSDDVGRFQELGVIASVQPSHLLSDMRWAPDILGPGRVADAYRWKSFLDAGVPLAFGTDYPVELINPMRGLYAAVTREFEAGGPDGGWLPSEKLTIEQAIEAYTLGAAYAEFEEHRKGTLAPGMFADIVVLSRDITKASARQILETQVLITIVGGEIMFERE